MSKTLFLMSLPFLLISQTSASDVSTKTLDTFVKQLVLNGSRGPGNSDGEAEFLMFAHGPIIEEVGYKYGVEMLASVVGSEQEDSFKAEYLEISYMELSYCDFVYAKAEDNRFLRKTIIYDMQGNSTEYIQFTRTDAPEDNNGHCNPVGESVVSTRNLSVSEDDNLFFTELMLRGIFW